MMGTRSLGWLTAGIVACFVIAGVVLPPGAGVAVAQNPHDTLLLNKAGNPDSIRINESGQKISDIEISLPDNADTSENIFLHLNLAEIESVGVNTSSASVSINSIQNGIVTNTTRLKSENTTLLRATIRPNSSAQPIQIDSAQISDINTSGAQKSTQIYYDIGISNSIDKNSTEITEKTDPFKIIDGNVDLHDQATVSPQLHRDTRTTAAITVSNVSGNTNSTLFITRGGENEIIGIQHLTKHLLKTRQTISVETFYPGGDVRAFLVANSTLDSTNHDIRDELSPKVTKSALSTDQGRVVNGDVNLSNRTYESPKTDNVTISSAKVSDTIEDETPFFVSLHPVNSSGHILQDVTIANSRVLSGWNENVSLYFNTTDNKSGIFQSNRYAAAIQLSRGYEVGDRISPEDADLLRNSDLNDQFVSGGVADSGTILIKRSVNSSNSRLIPGIHVKHNQSVNRPVYSGQHIYYNTTIDQDNT